MQPLLLALLLGSPALATAAAAQSIAGEWDATINTPGGVRGFKIVFQVSGDTLSGTVKRPAGDVPLAGMIQGNAVRFSYTINYNGDPLELTVIATLDGDSMKGTVDFGGAAQDEFTARRAPPSRPPAGRSQQLPNPPRI